MGINYYLHFQKCQTCGHEENPLHIGKSSAGWCFALHIYPETKINSLGDWINLFGSEKNNIKDEYGNEISTEDLIETITNRNVTSNIEYERLFKFCVDNLCEYGPNNLFRLKIGRFCVKHGDGTYDYVTGDFS